MTILTTPLKINKLTLKNRLVMPPMALANLEDGYVNEKLLAYYDEKSKDSAFGLVIIEHSYIAREGRAKPTQLSVATDDVVGGLKKLADIIHSNGSKTFMQINHSGSYIRGEGENPPCVAPSAVPHPIGGLTPRALMKEEIKKLPGLYRAAARRVKAAGFDGVEIHSAHSYLLNQFFSPLTNKRTDEYGGTLENRIRLHLEVIKEVRDEVGKDYPVMLRLGACDFTEGGITVEDSIFAAKAFEKAGIDAIDITGSMQGYTSAGGNTGEGYFSVMSRPIKEAISIPVILTGGIVTAAGAESMLKKCNADLIGVGRMVMKDSHWAKKALDELCK
ncbi:NADH:flavin oxidoreductase [Desulfitobacterium metallireducens]|uniref:NADH oxidase n=1 Tax=Desulfitobacterium metallireducens DSM 15288 TaxID=871968 RepID=W0E6Q7_9FIRM|nr:NADH:flavin oxidoreductase [Desulfitobacterium metallireducens]AHF06452.1 NADH oxidase [Desulfitobacterium metallireducens DSM 15288]